MDDKIKEYLDGLTIEQKTAIVHMAVCAIAIGFVRHMAQEISEMAKEIDKIENGN